MPSKKYVMEMKEASGVANAGFSHKDEQEAADNPRDPIDVTVDVKHPGIQNGDATIDRDEIQYDERGDIILQKKKINSDANPCARAIDSFQNRLLTFYVEENTMIWRVIGVILLIAYFVYFGFAMNHGQLEGEGSIRLLACTCLGVAIFVLYLTRAIHEPIRTKIAHFLNEPEHFRSRRVIRWLLYVVSLITTVTVIVVVVALDNPKNLVSLAGLAAFIFICFVTSYSPGRIDWHPVYWGFTLQFYFAALILRTRFGYDAFNWLGDRITEFLSYSDEGALFVFGDGADLTQPDGTIIPITAAYKIHFFAFKIMPVVTFFSSIISIGYYLGIMQKIITIIGRFLSFCLGTTPAESLNAAGNIFVAMTESPLMIKPFLGKMTSSELHAVMTGGFATIAGSVLGAYISFGVPPDHLLSASVMSAPAALAISKLTYPEIEIPIVRQSDYDKMEKSKENNVIEAACNGAIMSAKIIASIIVNVIAFLSLLKFVNATLIWFGDRVGKDDFTFEYICSYVLYPVAMFMGVDSDDRRRVAELVGIKTFTNEFIAYSKLAGLIGNRKDFNAHVNASIPTNTWKWDGDDIILQGAVNKTLEKGFISLRSEVIATYALCGFSNFGSMGILLGSLTAMAPHRQPTMSKLILRAMIAGNIACFLTACIAGLFYEEFD